MKKRLAEEQILGSLKRDDNGVAVNGLCRLRGISEASYCLWRSKCGGRAVSDAKLLAGSMLEYEVTPGALRKGGKRTGWTGAGALDDDQGVVGAAQP